MLDAGKPFDGFFQVLIFEADINLLEDDDDAGCAGPVVVANQR